MVTTPIEVGAMFCADMAVSGCGTFDWVTICKANHMYQQNRHERKEVQIPVIFYLTFRNEKIHGGNQKFKNEEKTKKHLNAIETKE